MRKKLVLKLAILQLDFVEEEALSTSLVGSSFDIVLNK